jgi:HlyD family secretion protein
LKVKHAAFTFQKYGMLERQSPALQLIRLKLERRRSQDTDENDPGISPYKALVTLKTQTLLARDSEWPLTPGMQIVAEFRQGERTVLEYLRSPVQKVLDEAGRER